MSNEFETIDVWDTDHATWIRLARPDALNALNDTMVREVRTAVAAAAADAPPTLVLTGAGRAFCAGADLKMVQSRRTADPSPLLQLLADVGALTQELEALPLPTVAMVNGAALAGGLELMMACDLVIAGRSATLGDGHSKFGLIPGGGATQRLPRLVGLSRALHLLYTADTLSADESLAIGLVNQVVDDADLEIATQSLAHQLSERSASGLARLKRLARAASQLSLAEGMELERQEAAEHLAGPDVAEGLAAFIERRTPKFR